MILDAVQVVRDRLQAWHAAKSAEDTAKQALRDASQQTITAWELLAEARADLDQLIDRYSPQV